MHKDSSSPFVQVSISSCWVICLALPADLLFLRALLIYGDALQDLSSDEWVYFWLCWSSYQKLVACVQLAKHVTLLLLRDLISSLLTTPSFHVTPGLFLLTGLSMHSTSDKVCRRIRIKGPPVPPALMNHSAKPHFLDLCEFGLPSRVPSRDNSAVEDDL